LKRKTEAGFNVPEEVKEREGMEGLEKGLYAKIAAEEVPSIVAICN
jgi:hypothetical protein